MCASFSLVLFRTAGTAPHRRAPVGETTGSCCLLGGKKREDWEQRVWCCLLCCAAQSSAPGVKSSTSTSTQHSENDTPSSWRFPSLLEPVGARSPTHAPTHAREQKREPAPERKKERRKLEQPRGERKEAGCGYGGACGGVAWLRGFSRRAMLRTGVAV